MVVVLMLLQTSDGVALARNLGLHPRPPPLKVAAPQLLILILQQQQQQQQNDDELLHLQGGQIAPSTRIQNGKLYVIFSLFFFFFVANSPVTLKMGQGH